MAISNFSYILINRDSSCSFADHEASMWRAVITQALMDAASNSKKPEAHRSKKEAYQWLKGESEDFVHVCDQAGMDPGYVREKAAQALLNGCQWRLPAGQGWRTQARLKAQIATQTIISHNA